VQEVRDKHLAQLDLLHYQQERHDRLCELNVIEQAYHVGRTTIVREAWSRGQSLAVHGWIYKLSDGLLRDLGLCLVGESGMMERYEAAVAQLSS
jgi:carbonic anhydrase